MKTLAESKAVRPEAARLLRKCKRLIHGLLPDATVLLYGSLARGTAGPDSDWDLLVLTEEPLASAEQDRVRDAVYDLQLEEDIVVSLLFRSRGEWDDPVRRESPFHHNVEREGVVL